MIGLSGLITPSLDEMVHVAKEMDAGFPTAAADWRRDDQHQAHGGQYCAGVSRDGDSRQGRACAASVGRGAIGLPRSEVMQAGPAKIGPSRPRNCERLRYGDVRPQTGLLRQVWRRFAIDWSSTPHGGAGVSGRMCACATFPWREIVPYIDWSPFFMTWELSGKYPHILSDVKVGSAARDLFSPLPRLLACHIVAREDC